MEILTPKDREADRQYKPTALKDIPDVARDMADIWKIDD